MDALVVPFIPGFPRDLCLTLPGMRPKAGILSPATVRPTLSRCFAWQLRHNMVYVAFAVVLSVERLEPITTVDQAKAIECFLAYPTLAEKEGSI